MSLPIIISCYAVFPLYMLITPPIRGFFGYAVNTVAAACPSKSERVWEQYTVDVSNDTHAKTRILDYFVNVLPAEVGRNPGISASIIDIKYYNKLADTRGFKRIPDDIHVAYLLYTHRGIHKSLIFHPNRHRARWATVRNVIDRAFAKKAFTVALDVTLGKSSFWCSKFEYEVEPLHDLTSNAYDELAKMALYVDLNKIVTSRADHYDVMSLANSTPDIALLGYSVNAGAKRDAIVIVHRTRGSWIQMASLLTIKLLGRQQPPVNYNLNKDMSVFDSCYEKLGTMIDRIGFRQYDWREACVDPSSLDNHARLTFEDHLWEFFNVNVEGLHPYQQAVLLLLCGALREAFFSLPSDNNGSPVDQKKLSTYTTDKTVGPYLSVVVRMLSPRLVQSAFLAKVLDGTKVSRVDYILGIWLGFVNSANLVRSRLSNVNLDDYMMSISPAPILSPVQKILLSFLGGVTTVSFLTALIMGTIRYCTYRKKMLEQRKHSMMFDSTSVIEYDSDAVTDDEDGLKTLGPPTHKA